MTKIDRRKALSGAVALGLSATALKARAQSAPATPAPPLTVFAKTPTVDKIAISPDGNRLSYVTQEGDNKFLIFFNLTDLKGERGALGPSKVRNIMWGDNEHVIVVQSYTAQLEGFTKATDEYYVARSLGVITHDMKTFFDHEEGYYGIIFGGLTRIKTDKGYKVAVRNVYMQGGQKNQDTSIKNHNAARGGFGTDVLFTFALDRFKGTKVFEFPEMMNDAVVCPDGRILAFSTFDANIPQWKLLLNQSPTDDMVSTRMVLNSNLGLYHPQLAGRGRDEDSVLTFISDNTGAGNYFEISKDGTLSAPLDQEYSGNHHPLFHPTTYKLAGFSHGGDWPSLSFFDPLLQKLTQALPGLLDEGDRWEIIDFAEDPRKFVLYVEGKGDPGNYYVIDFTTGNSTMVAQNYPGLTADWITEKHAIDYKAGDGLNIHAYLTLPPHKEAKNLPLVVLPHGGPQARDDLGFDWQAQALASRGYAVLQPNFRGSTGYGADFVIAGHGEWGRKMQTDLSDGVRHLVSKGMVDAKRVAIMGASYGGYAALAGATLDAGVYNCAISIAGISHIDGMLNAVKMDHGFNENTELAYWKEFLGDPKGYDDISPAKQAAKASCPVLLIHGEDDTVVPVDQSQRMNSALKAAGKTVEFITYKGQDHWETIESARIRMIEASVAFLAKYNPA